MALPNQENVPLNGAALQLRVTTEDRRTTSTRLRKNFHYRSPAGLYPS